MEKTAQQGNQITTIEGSKQKEHKITTKQKKAITFSHHGPTKIIYSLMTRTSLTKG